MRILFVAPRFHTNQFQLVKTLLQKNHEVIFHVACIGPTEDHSLLSPVRCKQNWISSLIDKLFGEEDVHYFPDLIHYWRVCKRLSPEIVVIRNPYRLFSLIAAFCFLFSQSKIIFYTQDGLYRARSKKTLLKQKLTLHFFRAAWMTPQLGNIEESNDALKHMYYVPLPITVGQTDRCAKDNYKEVKILMIGKYHQERKKHLLFIKAINNLKGKYDFKVTIVGECALEQQQKRFQLIKATVDELGLTNIIDLKVNIPFNKMEELYSSHDIYVLPSINELYGVSVIEALGFGLPVICTDTTGARFNIKEGENGYVVKSNSLEELTAALEKLVSNRNRINNMSKNSLRYAEHYLTGEVFYSHFRHLLLDRFALVVQ